MTYLDLYVTACAAGQPAIVRGRALAGERPSLGSAESSTLERLGASFKLLETDELSGLEVEVRVGDHAVATVTNHEGFFEAAFELAEGRYVALAQAAGTSTEAPVTVHRAGPGLAVISDIDDTVLLTGVTDKLALVRRVLLSTPADLQTFEGAPALYSALDGRGAPIVFVSGSPYNLEPRLRAFFALRGFPAAPMLLKDLGVSRDADPLTKQEEYKARRIAQAMAMFPERSFVLIGDSGERDPEVYARAAREHGARVIASYIHRVTNEAAEAERFSGQLLFSSYAEVARDLARRGLLT